jgi:hypothetical protein
MGTQKNVTLPKHLWSALDDMSRDASAGPDALMEQAVEQFVALQGYELPVSMPAAGANGRAPSLQDDEEDVGFARTQARSALTPELKAKVDADLEPAPAAPVRTEMAPTHKPAAAATPNITGLLPTHVPTKSRGGLAAIAPVATETGPAHTPEAGRPLEIAPMATETGPAYAPKPAASPAGKPKLTAAPAKPAPPPAWATRAALSDSDEERAAARERIVQIDADVEKLTIERPTTTPLGQPAGDDE